MKKLIWLALLQPTLTFAFPNNETFASCAAGGVSQDCYHINEAGGRLDALESSDSVQGTNIGILETNDAVQDGRLDVLEAAGPGGGNVLGPVPTECTTGTWAILNGQPLYPDGKYVYASPGTLVGAIPISDIVNITLRVGGDGGLTSVWSNAPGGISCDFYDQ